MADTSKKPQPDRAADKTDPAEAPGHRHEHKERVYEGGRDGDLLGVQGVVAVVEIIHGRTTADERGTGSRDETARPCPPVLITLSA